MNSDKGPKDGSHTETIIAPVAAAVDLNLVLTINHTENSNFAQISQIPENSELPENYDVPKNTGLQSSKMNLVLNNSTKNAEVMVFIRVRRTRTRIPTRIQTLIFVTSESDKNKTTDMDKVEIETSVLVGDLGMTKVNTSDTPLESREIQTSGLDENKFKKTASNINRVNISDTLSDAETDSGMLVRRTLVFIMILINLLWI